MWVVHAGRRLRARRVPQVLAPVHPARWLQPGSVEVSVPPGERGACALGGDLSANGSKRGNWQRRSLWEGAQNRRNEQQPGAHAVLRVGMRIRCLLEKCSRSKREFDSGLQDKGKLVYDLLGEGLKILSARVTAV